MAYALAVWGGHLAWAADARALALLLVTAGYPALVALGAAVWAWRDNHWKARDAPSLPFSLLETPCRLLEGAAEMSCQTSCSTRAASPLPFLTPTLPRHSCRCPSSSLQAWQSRWHCCWASSSLSSLSSAHGSSAASYSSPTASVVSHRPPPALLATPCLLSPAFAPCSVLHMPRPHGPTTRGMQVGVYVLLVVLYWATHRFYLRPAFAWLARAPSAGM